MTRESEREWNDGFASLARGQSQEGRRQERTAGQSVKCRSALRPATAFLLAQSAFLRSPPAAKQPSSKIRKRSGAVTFDQRTDRTHRRTDCVISMTAPLRSQEGIRRKAAAGGHCRPECGMPLGLLACDCLPADAVSLRANAFLPRSGRHRPSLFLCGLCGLLTHPARASTGTHNSTTP
jgi:hypothetical protein